MYADTCISFLSPASAKSGAGDMEMPGICPSVRPSIYIVSTFRFLFVDQLISNIHTSIILIISSLSSKLGKIRKKNSCKSIVFFIGKVHILRITHFSETTKGRSLIFGMGGDANVQFRMQHSPLPPFEKIFLVKSCFFL